MQHNSAQIKAGERLVLEKLTWVNWTSERRNSLESWGRQSLRLLENCVGQGYDALLAETTANWRSWWRCHRVKVVSTACDDQQMLDFALYHLRIMTPEHDERSSIAAKGLTGEGYKGHVFWDTEVFLLPFHLLTSPEKRQAAATLPLA